MSVNITKKLSKNDLDLNTNLSYLESNWYKQIKEYLAENNNHVEKCREYHNLCDSLGLYTREDAIRINDLYFNIPPTSIGVNISNNHIDIPQLRGRTSVKLDTGRGEISLSLSLVFSDNALYQGITLEEEIRYKLIPLMTQLTTIPFCEIENTYIKEKLISQIKTIEDVSELSEDNANEYHSYPLMFTYVGHNLSTSPDTPRMLYLNLQFLLFNYYPYINRLFYVDKYSRSNGLTIDKDAYGRKIIDSICANPFYSEAFKEFYAQEYKMYDDRLKSLGQSLNDYIHPYNTKQFSMDLIFYTYQTIPLSYVPEDMLDEVYAKVNNKKILSGDLIVKSSKNEEGSPDYKPKLLPLNIKPKTITLSPTGYFNAWRAATKTYHAGIDIAVPEGTPVYSTIKGKITSISNDKDGYGNYIVIQNSNTKTIYAHLKDTAKKKVGEEVEEKYLIGHTGKTGRASGPHLHYEAQIVVDGKFKAVNPLDGRALNNTYYSIQDYNTFKVKQSIFSKDDKKFPICDPSSWDTPYVPIVYTNKQISQYSEYIKKASQTYGVKEEYIAALISIESGGTPDIKTGGKKITKEEAKTEKSAVGLMQLQLATAKSQDIAPEDRIDPEKNIMAGTKYFASLLKKYKNDVSKAVFAYNQGNADGKGGAKNYSPDYPYVVSFWNHCKSIDTKTLLNDEPLFISDKTYTDPDFDKDEMVKAQKALKQAIESSEYEIVLDHNSLKYIYLRKKNKETIVFGDGLILLGIESSGMHNVPRIPISGYQYATHQYVGGLIKTVSLNLSSINKTGDIQLAKIQSVINVIENNARRYSAVASLDGIQIIEPYINTVLGATTLALSNMAIETDDTAPGVSNIAIQMTDFTFAKEFAKKEYRFDFEKRRFNSTGLYSALMKAMLEDLFSDKSKFKFKIEISKFGRLPMTTGEANDLSERKKIEGKVYNSNKDVLNIDGEEEFNKLTLEQIKKYVKYIQIKITLNEKEKEDSDEYRKQLKIFKYFANSFKYIKNIIGNYQDPYSIFSTFKKNLLKLEINNIEFMHTQDKWNYIFGKIGNNSNGTTDLFGVFDSLARQRLYELITLYSDMEASDLDEWEQIYSAAYIDYNLPPTINPDYYFYSENTMIVSDDALQQDIENKKEEAAKKLMEDYDAKWKQPFAASDFFYENDKRKIPGKNLARHMIEKVNPDYFTGSDGKNGNFYYSEYDEVTKTNSDKEHKNTFTKRHSSKKENCSHYNCTNAIIGNSYPINETGESENNDALLRGEFSFDSGDKLDEKTEIAIQQVDKNKEENFINTSNKRWMVYGDSEELAKSMHLQIARNNSQADNAFGMHMAFPAYKVYVIEDDTDEALAWTRRTDLNDFYGLNSIVELKVSMHNDQPADMLIVRFVDMTGKFSSAKHKAYHGMEDKSRNKRDKEIENPLKGLMLQEGTKIQCRMGYSNNINNLTTVFNGQIVSIEQSGNEYTLMCQSFGTELVYDVKYADGPVDITQFNAETKEILNWAITRPEIKNFGRWRLRGNPHYFDDSNDLNIKPGTYIKLRPDGTSQRVWSWLRTEADLNILAPEESSWQGLGLIGQSFKESPFNTVFQIANGPVNFFKALFKAWNSSYYVYRMTPWDIITDMTYRYPGYVAKVLPYEDRNTLFYGPPDAPYYARNFTLKEDYKASEYSEELDKINKDLQEKRESSEYTALLDQKAKYNKIAQYQYYSHKFGRWVTAHTSLHSLLKQSIITRKFYDDDLAGMINALGYDYKSFVKKYTIQKPAELTVLQQSFYIEEKNKYNQINKKIKDYKEKNLNPQINKKMELESQFKGSIKLMRQRHMASSMRNISANYIKADYRDVYTKATVHYSVPTDLERSKSVSWGDYSWADGTINIAMNDFILEEDYRSIEVVRQNIVTEDAAYRAGAHELWWQSKKLYKGELLMLGNPAIKPFDIITLLDYHSETFGPIEVQTHILSLAPGEGMLSLIIPGMVSRLSDLVSLSMSDAEEYVIKEQARSDMNSEAPNVPWAMKFAAGAAQSIDVQNWTAGISGVIAAAGFVALFTPAAFLGPVAIGIWALQAVMSWKLKTQMVMLSKYREPIYLQPLIKQGVPYIVGVNGFRYGTIWQYLNKEWNHFSEGLSNYKKVLGTAYDDIFGSK